MEKIAVYCEIDEKTKNLLPVSYELITKACDLKKEAMNLKKQQFSITAVIISDKIDTSSIEKCFHCGADDVVLIKDRSFNTFNQLTFAKAFSQYYNKFPMRVILFPATNNGRLLAPRITTILDTGLVADCTSVEFILKDDALKFAATRPTFGSELMATILSKKYPECATVRQNTFKAYFDTSKVGHFTTFLPTIRQDFRIKLLKTVLDDNCDLADFSDAKIVLAAGYGLLEGKNTEYIEKLQQLAQLIGARFASSRKLVDYGYTDASAQIGQTGSTVAANLYIAFGISGAIQHVCGMKNSKVIVAVNTDSNAPIFNYSDYKIVADAKTIINELYSSFSGN